MTIDEFRAEAAKRMLTEGLGPILVPIAFYRAHRDEISHFLGNAPFGGAVHVFSADETVFRLASPRPGDIIEAWG